MSARHVFLKAFAAEVAALRKWALTCDKLIVSSDAQSSFTKIFILVCTTVFSLVLILRCTEGPEEL